jgi:hypothetical protein
VFLRGTKTWGVKLINQLKKKHLAREQEKKKERTEVQTKDHT